MNTNKSATLLIITIIVLVIVDIAVLVWHPWAKKEHRLQLQGKQPTTNQKANKQAQNNSFKDWETYRNKEYGFEVKYPVDFNLVGKGKEVYLYSVNYAGAKIYIMGSKNLSVPLSGTFGGRYQYSEGQTPMSKVFSEKEGNFTKDYFLEYGGMGSWDTAINAYQQKNGSYYIISLYRSRHLGTPGSTEENGAKLSEQKIISRTLAEMRNKNDKYTKIFNQILSTFRFVSQDQSTMTTRWETYHNEKYGYEIEYPEEWYVQKSGQPPYPGPPTGVAFASVPFRNDQAFPDNYCPVDILSNYTDNEAEITDLEKKEYKRDNIMVSGIPAIRLTLKSPTSTMDFVYFSHEKKNFRINQQRPSFDNGECLNIFDHMISTFKFSSQGNQ